MAEGIPFDIVPAEKIKNQMHLESGGFGDVYKGEHEDWGISVAVKVLREPTGLYSQADLIKEAKIMNRARFDYILRLYGIYRKQEQGVVHLGIVMEYMANGSLDSLLKQVVPLPWALRFRILHEVALGMNYLHGLNPPLLHLDLKPSNVLLDESFHVRLTDFGLSKWKKASTVSRASPSSGVGGTLPYMPPEAFADLNYKPNQAFDIYSYGILMWSVVTGEEPYSAALQFPTGVQILVQQGQRPDSEILPDDLLPELKDLMQRCWSQEPSDRPHFKECIGQIKELFDFEANESEIQHAVRRVQDTVRRIRRGSMDSEVPCLEETLLCLDMREGNSIPQNGDVGSSQPALAGEHPSEDSKERLKEKLSNITSVVDHLAAENIIRPTDYLLLKDSVLENEKVQNTLNPLLEKGAKAVVDFYHLLSKYDHDPGNQ